MRIEDYWEDVSLFLIEYLNYKNQLIKVTDFVILPLGLSDEEVEKNILILFPDAKSICSIYLYSEALFEK